MTSQEHMVEHSLRSGTPSKEIKELPESRQLSKGKASMGQGKAVISKDNISRPLYPDLAQRAEMHAITR
jgi:hypothetical protein